MKEEFTFLEVGGFGPALEAMRYPTQSKGDSHTDENGKFILGPKDQNLAKRLLGKTETLNDVEVFQGDTHGKFARSIIAWFRVSLTRSVFSEFATYVVGVSPTSSTSTMYTLKKEIKNGDVRKFFHDKTPESVIDNFLVEVEKLLEKYGDMNSIPIDVLKYCLPEGFIQTRNFAISYQTLRRIYLQRNSHRMPEWHTVCKSIEKLPYFEELINIKED
jgi:hypothetical protein